MRYVSGGAPTRAARSLIGFCHARSRTCGPPAADCGWPVSAKAITSSAGCPRHPGHSRQSELELSYRLGRRWWGSGLATESSGALITMAFRTLGTQRVFTTTTAANVGSRRVMEKLGMCLTWVAMPDDCADPDLADVEYELSVPSGNSGRHRRSGFAASPQVTAPRMRYPVAVTAALPPPSFLHRDRSRISGYRNDCASRYLRLAHRAHVCPSRPPCTT